MKRYFFFVLLSSVVIYANEYFVVSSKDIQPLTKKQLKAIFLKKLKYINGKKVIPVNLSAKNPMRDSFEKEVFSMHFSELKRYWTQQHYLGKRSPLSMQSQESVKRVLKKIDGSLSYVDREHLSDDLYVLYRWRSR